jgi:hypothetical protein
MPSKSSTLSRGQGDDLVSTGSAASSSVNPSRPRDPLIKLRPYAMEPFWQDDIGIVFWLWRRQAGKSFTAACKALRRMMEVRGLSSYFVSASVALGVEFVRKEAEVWQKVLLAYKQLVAANGQQFETNCPWRDGLPEIDALCDLFEHQRLQTKIWHDRTTYSRSVVIAPNPDTAVGWTGDIWMDEVGRMPDFKEVLEAVLPFMSSNPQFRLLMITTPPPDDSHYSWEMFIPPMDQFPVSEKGNWYESQSGFTVHRVDAWDAAAAGIPMYDDKTRQPLTPEEHRARAFDKQAWDRNFALKFITGGLAAVSTASLATAMAAGRGQCLGLDISEEIFLPS